MIASPSPVQEIATVASSAQVPAAISGESPTRPGCLRRLPPVEVAAATPPWASSATAPTVSRARRAALSPVRNQSSGRFEPGVARERSGRVADQHHVAPLVEHRPRRADRVADPAQGGHRTRRAVGAAHDRRVMEHRALLVEHRAAARVEHRVVLEHDDRGLHGRERVAAGREYRVPGVRRPLDARERAAVRVWLPAPRPAVDDDRDHARHDTRRSVGRVDVAAPRRRPPRPPSTAS